MRVLVGRPDMPAQIKGKLKLCITGSSSQLLTFRQVRNLGITNHSANSGDIQMHPMWCFNEFLYNISMLVKAILK